MTALKVLTVITAPALIGFVSEPLAWLALFVLPFLFAVGKKEEKK